MNIDKLFNTPIFIIDRDVPSKQSPRLFETTVSRVALLGIGVYELNLKIGSLTYFGIYRPEGNTIKSTNSLIDISFSSKAFYETRLSILTEELRQKIETEKQLVHFIEASQKAIQFCKLKLKENGKKDPC